MQILQAPRASAIIYNLLISRADTRPWLLPANICPIVPLTFFKARVPFVLVDISEQTLHMNLERADDLLKTRKYGGLLYAHTYGEPSTPQDFFGIIKSNNPDLFLLDDRCLCVPDLEPSPETKADLILYSTGYAKIAELNHGGFAFLKDGVDYRISHLRFDSKDLDGIEYAYKQAVQSRRAFEYQDSQWLETDADLPGWYDYHQQVENNLVTSLKHRAKINNVYVEKLPLETQLPGVYQSWRFNIRVKNKKDVLGAIFEARLFASSHYASLAGILSDDCAPVAESLADEVINLFNDHRFTTSQAEMACSIISEKIS